MSRETTKRIYVLSGLGADERVFREMDFGAYQPVFIRWIPVDPAESLEGYAQRLLAQIPEPQPVLLGLSFGGVMALEIATLIPVNCVIQIASVCSPKELPWYYRLAGRLGLHRLVPVSWLKHYNRFSIWLFGAEARGPLFRQILADTDPVFLRWAIRRLLGWKGKPLPQRLFRIHGTADRVLPIRYIGDATAVEGGGHLMTLDKAGAVSNLLQQIVAIRV